MGEGLGLAKGWFGLRLSATLGKKFSKMFSKRSLRGVTRSGLEVG